MAGAAVVGKLASLAYTVLAVRVLSAAEFGAFAYALAAAALLGTFPEWGFDTVLARRGSAAPEKLGAITADVLSAKLALGVVVLGLGGTVLAVSRPTPDGRTAMVLILIATMVELLMTSGGSVATARQRQGRIAVAMTVRQITTAVISSVALLAGFGLVGLASGYLAGTVAGAAVTLMVVSRLDARVGWSGVSWERLRALSRESALIGVFAVAGAAIFRLDQVMLEAISGERAVASYAVSYRLLETVLFIAWSVQGALFPVFSAEEDPRRVAAGLERALAAVVAVYVPFSVVTVVMPSTILQTVFGDSYAVTSAGSLRWLGLTAVPFAVAFLVSNALLARSFDRLVVVVSVGVLGLNIALNLWLIPLQEGVGAAVATISTYLVQAVVMVVLFGRRIGTLRLGSPFVPSIGSGLVMGLVLLLPLPDLVAMVLSGVAYIGTWTLISHRFAPQGLADIGRVFGRTPAVSIVGGS